MVGLAEQEGRRRGDGGVDYYPPFCDAMNATSPPSTPQPLPVQTTEHNGCSRCKRLQAKLDQCRSDLPDLVEWVERLTHESNNYASPYENLKQLYDTELRSGHDPSWWEHILSSAPGAPTSE